MGVFVGKKRYIIWFTKVISALLSFILIWCGIQPFFVPKYLDDSAASVEGYSFLKNNSLDVLFLGASQMFCTVDAKKLTDEYGISSYDFGASLQSLSITPYYLQEALKTQNPKLVMVEVCTVFDSETEINQKVLSMNYSPTRISCNKFHSIKNLQSGGITKAFQYTFAPLALYHHRWRNMTIFDLDFEFEPEKYIDLSQRGFLARDHIEKCEILYYTNDLSLKNIPTENVKSILELSDLCKRNIIDIVFFKAPVPNWTKGDSLSVKKLMDEYNLVFVDLNDYLEEIGINKSTDFYNKEHLNVNGAGKTTDYLAKIIPQYLH